MLENTNIKQFYPGPILNKTLDITDFLFKDPEQVHITYTYKNADGSLSNRELTYGIEYEVVKVLPSDVTQADAALTASTGRVMLKADLNVALGERLTVYRESAIIQEAQYPRTGPFPAASHEGALDYLTMQNQEQQDQIDRSLKVPISTANFDGALPIPVPARALKINNSGSGFEFSEYDPDTALETTKEYMESAQTAASSALASQNAAASSASSIANSEIVATQQANIATQQAIIATNKTNEVVASGNEALSNIDTAKNNAITTITAIGNNYDNLTHKNITNCLLEVPQKIKLELNDGVLTLKAGSQVIIPNGFEADGTTPKFSEVIINSDKSLKQNFDNNEMFLFVSITPNGDKFINTGFKGSTLTNQPTPVGDYKTYYITNENRIFWDAPGLENYLSSFPIAIVNRSAAIGFTSINQIFNGMGYIGSTVWLDKGVKGLIPNGRNEDGSLINLEYTRSKLSLNSVFSPTTTYLQSNATKIGEVVTSNYHETETEPKSPSGWSIWYKPSENIAYVKNIGDSSSKWTPQYVQTGLAEIVRGDNGKITSFAPKLPFRAADYNDIDGRWVSQSVEIINGETVFPLGSKKYRDYDISNYLPNDGHIYELAVEIIAFSGSSTNATSHWWVSDILGTYGTYQTCSCGGKAYSNSRDEQYANGRIPMATRTLRLWCSSTGTAPTIRMLKLSGYRKVR